MQKGQHRSLSYPRPSARRKTITVLCLLALAVFFLFFALYNSFIQNLRPPVPSYGSNLEAIHTFPGLAACEKTILYESYKRLLRLHALTTLGAPHLLAQVPLFDSVYTVIGGRTTLFNTTVLPLFQRFWNSTEKQNHLPDLYKDGAFLCGMALLYSTLCEEDEESVLRCMRNVGTEALGQILPSICQDTPYYAALNQTIVQMETKCGAPAPPTSLPLGIVDETQLLSLSEELTALALAPGSTLMQRAYNSEGLTREEEDLVRRAYYVPIEQRTVADMPPAHKCPTYTIYSINFAVTHRPAHVPYRERRLFPFFPIIPSIFGRCYRHKWETMQGYVLTDESLHEWLYATIMRYSMFGYSHMRGGWACLRNQEMVFYGAVPVLVDLLLAGPLFLGNSPRQLMHDVLVQEPLLQKVGYMKDTKTIVHGNSSIETSADGKYFRRCGKSNVNFVRPGELDLEPYREEHKAYYAQKGVAPPPPLTHLSPAVVPHFSRWARPLWDSYPRHSAAAMVQYLLNTVGCPDPKRVLVIGYSSFTVDYTHQSIVTGFNDLGIFVDSFVQLEGDMFQRLSFYNHSKEKENSWTKEEKTELEKLRAAGYIGDPRTIGMRAWEKERGARLQQAYGSFSMMGRWNPLLVRRIDGSAARPVPEQDSYRNLPENRDKMKARLQTLLNKEPNRYDLVIYSVFHYEGFVRNKTDFTLYADISKHVPKERLVFCDHTDYSGDVYHTTFGKSMTGYGWLFQREVVSACSA